MKKTEQESAMRNSAVKGSAVKNKSVRNKTVKSKTVKSKTGWKVILSILCMAALLAGCSGANVTDEVGGWEQGKKEQGEEESGTDAPGQDIPDTEDTDQGKLSGSQMADVTPVDDNPFKDIDPADYNTDTPGEGVEIFVDRAFGPYLLLRCENHGNVSYGKVKFELQVQSDFPDCYADGICKCYSSFDAVPPYGTGYCVYGPMYVESVIMKGGDSGDRIYYEDLQLEDVVSFEIEDYTVSEDLYVNIRPFVNVVEDIDAAANRWGYLQDDVVRGAGLSIPIADIKVIVDGKEVVRLNRGDDRTESGRPLEPAAIQYPLVRDGMTFGEWEEVHDQYDYLDLSESHTYEVIIETLECAWK